MSLYNLPYGPTYSNNPFNTTLYGFGNKPHFVSYSGGSTYTTQTYGKLPEWKLANTMTTEFGSAINGETKPIATFDGQVFNGFAQGLWIYRLFKDGDLVATYQFQDQAFCIPVIFDRVEGVGMSVSLTPSVAFTDTATSTPIPAPSGFFMLICSAIFCLRKTSRNA